ncbi:Zinc finger C2H2 type domain-containing protein 3 [Elsinoe fawcettii]|nr:Zinc finger C2H2 type domain-containing protein 3 [Elsinoe fawcettii]
MSHRKTTYDPSSRAPRQQQPHNPAPQQQLALRPPSIRSISAPGYQVPSTESFGLNSPVSPSEMATLLNAYSGSHHFTNERSSGYSNASNMDFVSTSGWQTQNNFVTMPNMADNSGYVRQHQTIQESNPWLGLRPSPSIHDLDFASEVSAASSPFIHPAESYLVASPHIKAEDSDSSSVFMSRTQPIVPSNATQASRQQYQYPMTPLIKEERLSPLLDQRSSRHSVSSQSISSHDSNQNESEDGSSAEPRRKKRIFANEETAKHQCHICKQFFQRSYNLKSHMKTHDPTRIRAFPCLYQACDKTFERRADLTRHVDSVHIRDKKYPCPQCGSRFTRKDTARRHMEDGCSKRLDVKQRRTGQSSRRGRHRSNSDAGAYVKEEMPTDWH